MDTSTNSQLSTIERDGSRQPPEPTHRTLGRRFVRASAGVLVLMLLGAMLMACGPSGAGCRRASSSSSTVVTDSGIAPIHAGTLMGPFPAQPRPAKDERRFNCTKQESPVWKKLKSHKGSIKTNGKKGKAARFYEWDHTHNDIEEYGPAPKYKHLGSVNPIDGDQYKGPVKDRNLRSELK